MIRSNIWLFWKDTTESFTWKSRKSAHYVETSTPTRNPCTNISGFIIPKLGLNVIVGLLLPKDHKKHIQEGPALSHIKKKNFLYGKKKKNQPFVYMCAQSFQSTIWVNDTNATNVLKVLLVRIFFNAMWNPFTWRSDILVKFAKTTTPTKRLWTDIFEIYIKAGNGRSNGAFDLCQMISRNFCQSKINNILAVYKKGKKLQKYRKRKSLIDLLFKKKIAYGQLTSLQKGPALKNTWSLIISKRL